MKTQNNSIDSSYENDEMNNWDDNHDNDNPFIGNGEYIFVKEKSSITVPKDSHGTSLMYGRLFQNGKLEALYTRHLTLNTRWIMSGISSWWKPNESHVKIFQKNSLFNF